MAPLVAQWSCPSSMSRTDSAVFAKHLTFPVGWPVAGKAGFRTSSGRNGQAPHPRDRKRCSVRDKTGKRLVCSGRLVSGRTERTAVKFLGNRLPPSWRFFLFPVRLLWLRSADHSVSCRFADGTAAFYLVGCSFISQWHGKWRDLFWLLQWPEM